jgi:RNA polymerase sigma-70 factor (ECF subfamily)
MAVVMTSPSMDESRTLSVADLVAEAKSGDRTAFDALVLQFERQVLRTAWRLLGNLEDAQDASQDVFLRLYKYLGRFDEERNLSPWLYRVTVNCCRDIARKRAKWGDVPLREGYEEEIPDPEDGHSLTEGLDQKKIIHEGLKTLSEKERAALVLRDIEGLSTREVARTLGSTEMTVRSHISRARVKMKRYRDRVLGRQS